MWKNVPKQGFKAVVLREIKRMVSRRLYFGVTVILPLFCIFFMATIFNTGQMENIPIGIVDLDQTATSRNIVRNVAAVPTFKVTEHLENPAAARLATQRKEIYGYLVIPRGFESRMMDGKNTTLDYYYHYALLSVGGEVLGAFENVLEPIAITPVVMTGGSLGLTSDQIMSFIMPTDQRSHPLFNPDLDYSVYLSVPFFFVFFQVIILLTSVYIVGSEINFGTAEDWLDTARGNIFIAIFGKFLPYTVVFSILTVFANYVMFGLMHIPFSCGYLPLNLSSILLVLASQGLGLFLFSLFPVMGLIISIVSMVGSLGATLSGVTFPVPDMHPIVHAASTLFPIRHFVLINQNLLYGDYGFTFTWHNYAVLFIYLLLPLLLLPRLKRLIITHKYEGIE
ncbi:MAG: ABC transporter permease [Bacteroidales bacterium]